MTVDVAYGDTPIKSVQLSSRRGGHPEPYRNIVAVPVGEKTIVFTVSLELTTPANIEVPKSEALAFADYLRKMCTQ